jgi:hypothetical protein
MDEERRDFLPPEPTGPEPELGQPPPPQAPPPPAYQPQPWPPQPQQQGYPPPQPQAPVPGPQAPPPTQPYGGYQQPPPPGYPAYGWQQPGWGHPPQQPDNGSAVAGFVLSLVSGGLLFISVGLSSIISVACSIFAIVYSRKGKKKVESGETAKHAGLAQAGFIIGIVGLVLAVLATLFWTLFWIAYATDEELREDLENDFENSESISAVVRVAGAAGRLLLG